MAPHLYHATVAAIWKVVPGPAVPESKKPWVDPEIYGAFAGQVRIAQLVSCAAGLLTLFVVWLFLAQIAFPGKTRLCALGLVALNPKLISINAQATNDSMAILLATLTLYCAYAFFTSGKAIAGVWALIFAILAGLTKGTGLVVFLAVLTTAALLLLLGRGAPALSRRRLGLYTIVSCVGYLAIVPTVGPYGTHYLKYGSPFTLNDQKFTMFARRPIDSTIGFTRGVTSAGRWRPPSCCSVSSMSQMWFS